ncbi:MAG: hypothetical protein EOO15_05785 [Chitinophagaceae bacterium]|nr:MAG: hypothetical protein EOO15_05785 [Chitinophagaceae bacterium]
MTTRTKQFQNCLGVFQGGGVKALAYAGAFEEAVKRGVFFSELVGASAGSIISVLIGGGANPTSLNQIIERLDFNEFIKRPNHLPDFSFDEKFRYRWGLGKDTEKHLFIKFFRYLGAKNADYIASWINTELQKLLNIRREVKFRDLKIPTSVVSTDVFEKKIQVWSTYDTPDFPVGLAVQASCSIPFYFQPVNKRYVDGGLLSNLPSFLAKPETIFDKILAFGLRGDDAFTDVGDARSFFTQLINTTIDGAVDIQLSMQDQVHVIYIDTGVIQATDFKKIGKAEKISLIKNGKDAAAAFFDNEEVLASKSKREDVAVDIFETFNFVVRSMYYDNKEILISDDKPAWVYSLFPLLLKWIQTGTKIRVLLKLGAETPVVRQYKTKLLRGLGCAVDEVANIPFKGFIIYPKNTHSEAVIFNLNSSYKVNSKYYKHNEDAQIIEMLRSHFDQVALSPTTNFNLVVEEVEAAKIFELLRNVRQYSGRDVRFDFKLIDIKDIRFLTKYNKGYKYRQIDNLIAVFEDFNIGRFKSARFKLNDGDYSYITPPIIEKRGTKYFTIEGNARILNLHKRKIEKVYAIIIENVFEGLPSSGDFGIEDLLISDKVKRGEERYPDYRYEYFRKIEEAIHNT